MHTKKTNMFSIINISLLVLYIFSILFFTFTDDSTGMGVNREKIASFNEGWTISYNDIVETTTKLPQNYHLKPGTVYSIERTINREDFIYPILRIRSSMMDVNAYIDDQQIYSFDMTKNINKLNGFYPSSWQLLNIPIADSIGKTLKITFSTPTTQFSGLLNTIMIGEGEAIILNLIKENFINLIISLFIILFSIFAIITMFWTKKLGIKKHIIYLSAFGISAGLWIISESTLLQILIPNRFLISSTSYILNLVLPLIIVLFFRDIVLKGFKKLTTYLATSIIVLLICEMILQVTGILSLLATTIFSIIIITIAAFIILYTLINEGYKKDNSKARQYLLIFIALFVSAAIIMGLFLLGVYQNLGKYLAFGVFGFFLLIMIDAIKSLHDLMEARNKSLIYKQLAYEDYLTKGWNRTAFERDVEKLIDQRKVFRLALLDLNHLKKINDTYGHIEGDYAIVESYNAIKETINDTGKSYRISGDEFACIIYDTDNKLFEDDKEIINKKLEKKSINKPYNIVLALGTKIYNGNENFTEFYKQVDTEMYKHKKILKAKELSNK